MSTIGGQAMLKDFKAFINRGNVLDLAVAVIIGAAFGKIVASLTDDIIMPVIGKIVGDVDFSNYFIRLGPLPANYAGSLDSYADLKKAGVSLLGYGTFITAAVNFLILAFVVFLIVRAASRMIEPPKVEAAPDGPDVVLLREIRDELRKRG
jgi:large conductance mechanosensitive channel